MLMTCPVPPQLYFLESLGSHFACILNIYLVSSYGDTRVNHWKLDSEMTLNGVWQRAQGGGGAADMAGVWPYGDGRVGNPCN